MQASNAAVELIKQFEGFVSKSYLDPVGIPTIGFGHRVLKGETFPPDGITEAWRPMGIHTQGVCISSHWG